MADDVSIHTRIDALIAEERSLRATLAAGEITRSQEHERLSAVETQLDQCWDLLRQRQGLRDAGEDPADASVRPADVVENYEG